MEKAKLISLPVLNRGERWDTLDGSRTCRVMNDPVEGYVMARFKGAAPWLLHVNDWHKKFKRKGLRQAETRWIRHGKVTR